MKCDGCPYVGQLADFEYIPTLDGGYYECPACRDGNEDAWEQLQQTIKEGAELE